MRWCYSCLKFLFILFNIIFLVFGIAGVVLVVWLLIDHTIPLHFTQDPEDFMIATVMYLVFAILLILLSILGLYSAIKDARWAVIVSICLLLIVIVVEVASGVWTWINLDTLDEFARSSAKRTIQEYDTSKNMRDLLDSLQSKMHCCGVDSPSDWARNKDINLGIASKPTKFNIPESCCRKGIADSQCIAVTQEIKIGESPNYDVIHPRGCHIVIKEFILKNLTCVFSTFGSIVGIKVLGLLIGLILAFAMNGTDHYKA
ncbi:hypothetical protein ABEB36_005847 [Hypothenemus hampei]|uniref:Tetraspanin n=1 Tax=Hypothenemus hampei TaxID=57062 RepID=A0ABD1F0A2_HYPHA